MSAKQSFEARFTEIFNPVFLWGVGACELALVLYTFYLEFATGTGPSLISTVLPLSIAIAIAWAVLSVLITLVIVGLKKHKKP